MSQYKKYSTPIEESVVTDLSDVSNTLANGDIIVWNSSLEKWVAMDPLNVTASGGDFTDGGEAGGADRTLGNTDAYALGLLTNNLQRIHITSGGDVGIGVSGSAVTNLLTVGGTLGVTGNADFSGSVTLGNAAADVVTVTGQLTASEGLSVGVANTGKDAFFYSNYSDSYMQWVGTDNDEDVKLTFNGLAGIEYVSGSYEAFLGVGDGGELTTGVSLSSSADIGLHLGDGSNFLYIKNAATDTTAASISAVGVVSASSDLTIGGNASLNGTLDVNGSVTLNDNVTLGSANSDVVTATGQLTASEGLTVSKNTYFNASVDLGSENDGKNMTWHSNVSDSNVSWVGNGTVPTMTFNGLAKPAFVSGSVSGQIIAGQGFGALAVSSSTNIAMVVGDGSNGFEVVHGPTNATVASISGLGVISGSAALQIGGATSLNGTLDVNGVATFNDNVTLGGAATDVVTTTGQLTASEGVVVGADNSGKNATFYTNFAGKYLEWGGLLAEEPSLIFYEGAFLELSSGSFGAVVDGDTDLGLYVSSSHGMSMVLGNGDDELVIYSGAEEDEETETEVAKITAAGVISGSSNLTMGGDGTFNGLLAVAGETTAGGYGITLPSASEGNSGFGLGRTWLEYSSERFKNDVKTLKNPIKKVMSLRGVSYEWKDSGMKDVGLIAEEVNDVFPEVVHKDNKGVPYSLNYARLTAVLIEAMKEQQKQIEDLKKKKEVLFGEVF